MGYPTKIQLIKRASSQQWYVNVPAAIAQSLGLEQGEVFEWTIEDRGHLHLLRAAEPKVPWKKKLQTRRRASR